VWRKVVTDSEDATVEYISGPFVWVTTQAEAERVARALQRDDQHYDALIPETGRMAASEAARRRPTDQA
jgi:hypothetical protein